MEADVLLTVAVSQIPRVVVAAVRVKSVMPRRDYVLAISLAVMGVPQDRAAITMSIPRAAGSVFAIPRVVVAVLRDSSATVTAALRAAGSALVIRPVVAAVSRVSCVTRIRTRRAVDFVHRHSAARVHLGLPVT